MHWISPSPATDASDSTTLRKPRPFARRFAAQASRRSASALENAVPGEIIKVVNLASSTTSSS